MGQVWQDINNYLGKGQTSVHCTAFNLLWVWKFLKTKEYKIKGKQFLTVIEKRAQETIDLYLELVLLLPKGRTLKQVIYFWSLKWVFLFFPSTFTIHFQTLPHHLQTDSYPYQKKRQIDVMFSFFTWEQTYTSQF